MANALTLKIRRLPHRAFNSANKQRGETDIREITAQVVLGPTQA